MEETGVRKKRKRNFYLKNERMSWLEHWRELADYTLPRQYRYLTVWTNKGWKRNQNIINNTPTRALRTMAAGMMSGITSPARPWFRLTMKDKDLSEYAPVRNWLDMVQDRLTETFASSNIYNCLHSVYSQLGLFGTAALHVDEDAKDLLRGYVFPIGQYSLANSSRLQVDSIYREFQMTATQMKQAFKDEGLFSTAAQNALKSNGDQWFNIVHAIEPNDEQEYGRGDFRGKPWKSCWFETVAKRGRRPDAQECLPALSRGYEEFPAMAPRWNVVGEDVYGESPGMDALGDIKALQLVERRKAQVFDKVVNPPMRGPTSMRTQRASLLPGDITYVDVNANGQTFAPAVEIPPNAAQVAEGSAREHEQRIEATFYADLWMSMMNNDNADMTAREVVERHEEKMIWKLWPVMERVEGELLKPLIERARSPAHLRAGRLPPPPMQAAKQLAGQEIQIEYLSIMAQAQKMLGSSAVERLAGFVQNLATAKPEVFDKLNTDKMVEMYGDMLGVPSSLIVPDDQVAQIRQQRAQQQAEAQQAQNALAVANSAKTLSETDTENPNGLTRLLGSISPAAAAAAGSVQ